MTFLYLAMRKIKTSSLYLVAPSPRGTSESQAKRKYGDVEGKTYFHLS